MSWTRRQFMFSSSAAVVGGWLRGVPAFGQQPPAAPTPTTFMSVRGNVGIFTGRGGTIGWYIARDGAVVVDSQFPDTAKACVDGLKERSKPQIDALINTHHHGDHTAGNTVFKPIARKIVAHVRCPDLQKQAAVQQGTEANQVYADTTFADTWSMNIGADKISAKYYGSGHTGGDIVITFDRDDVVHMGDLMFHHRHPFVDRPAGASIRNWIVALEKITKEHGEPTIYIFGHARDDLRNVGSRAEVLLFRDYLSAVVDYVQKGIAAGRSKEDVTKLAALPKFEDYAETPPRLTLAGVLAVAYDELTSKS